MPAVRIHVAVDGVQGMLSVFPAGNGDIFSYDDWKSHQQMLQDNTTGDEIGLCDCAMIGRRISVSVCRPC